MYAFDLANASNPDLEDFYRELTRYEMDIWKNHFYYMKGIAIVNSLFEDLAIELCGVSSDTPTFTRLTFGFECKELPAGVVA